MVGWRERDGRMKSEEERREVEERGSNSGRYDSVAARDLDSQTQRLWGFVPHTSLCTCP